MKKLDIFQKTVAAVLASSIVLLTGCSKDENSERRINDILKTDTSFTDILNSINDKTNLDENLSDLSYESSLEEYVAAREKSDIEESNKALSDLGKKIIEASVCDYLGIDPKDVVDFQYYAIEDMKYIPNCTIKYYKHKKGTAVGNINVDSTKLVKEKYYLGKEARDQVFNTYHAYMGHLKNEKEIDDVFNAYQRYLLTSGERKSDDEISFDYDDEKIDQLEKYKKR